MVNIEELEKENAEIIDLCGIISVLVEHPQLRANPVFCELLSRFVENVKGHLQHEEREVYSELLTHPNRKLKDAASRFMSNTNELKKIFNTYIKQWCSPAIDNSKDELFKNETKDMFRLIKERIQMEKEELFPLVKK